MEFQNLRIEKITHVLSYRPDRMHWFSRNRKDHIVGIQLSGAAMHTMGERKLLLSDLCFFFLNQKDDYEVDVYEPGESLSAHFTTTEEIATDSFCLPVAEASQIISSLKKLKSCFEGYNELLSLSLLYRICAELQSLRAKKYFPKERRMAALKQYIDTHYGEREILHTTVEKSGLTARRFTDLFQNCFHITPNRYIVLRRIEAAKALLETNMFSVTAIAEQCGFSDVYYFSKVFKKETGISPGQYSGRTL